MALNCMNLQGPGAHLHSMLAQTANKIVASLVRPKSVLTPEYACIPPEAGDESILLGGEGPPVSQCKVVTQILRLQFTFMF